MQKPQHNEQQHKKPQRWLIETAAVAANLEQLHVQVPEQAEEAAQLPLQGRSPFTARLHRAGSTARKALLVPLLGEPSRFCGSVSRGTVRSPELPAPRAPPAVPSTFLPHSTAAH